MPDNVREGGFKSTRRKVPQKIYRLGGNAEVRVKRCGKSAPPRQRCSGQGKPHTEQDQIGRKFRLWPGHVPARCVKPSGRSLEARSNARPRGMTVLPGNRRTKFGLQVRLPQILDHPPLRKPICTPNKASKQKSVPKGITNLITEAIGGDWGFHRSH